MERNELTRIQVHISLEEQLKRIKQKLEEDMRKKGYDINVCKNQASRIAARILEERQDNFNLYITPRNKRKSRFFF